MDLLEDFKILLLNFSFVMTEMIDKMLFLLNAFLRSIIDL